MKPIDLTIVNAHSAYMVWLSNRGRYMFETDYDIVYAVSFEFDDSLFHQAYWLNLTNVSHSKSPNDTKIPQTLICIVEEFFRQNPDILLYLCSTDNEQQASRSRLFLRWFNGYEQQKKYAILTSEVRGEGQKEYVSMIVPRSHPQLEDIIQAFNDEIALFNDNKPL